MTFALLEVDVSDAQDIAQYVQVPAMQTGPLHRTMFPRPDTMTTAQKNEVVRWYADMLEEAFQDRWESFVKVCSADSTPIGFCGWTIIDRTRNCEVKENDCQASEPAKLEKRKKETWIPEAIDIVGWTTLSKALRTERDRVLKDLDNICRKPIYVVALSSPLTGSVSRPDVYGS